MIKFFCDFCSAEISAEVVARRHLSDARMREQRHYCNREHAVAHRSARGEYKDISVKGKEKRSLAVTKSNREQPRRRKQSVLQ